MKRHVFYVLFSAALLSGFAGAARAELDDAVLQNPAPAKVVQPAPVSRPSHVVASHRIVVEHRPAATLTMLRQEFVCNSLACGQFALIGIGFGF